MKTTVEISDPLLREVRELAAREGVHVPDADGTRASSRRVRDEVRRTLQATPGQLQGERLAGRAPRGIVGRAARSDLWGSRRLIAVDTKFWSTRIARIRHFTRPPWSGRPHSPKGRWLGDSLAMRARVHCDRDASAHLWPAHAVVPGPRSSRCLAGIADDRAFGRVGRPLVRIARTGRRRPHRRSTGP